MSTTAITIRHLPPPWSGQEYQIPSLYPVNFFVGPTGTGKSRFAGALCGALNSSGTTARLLGTDRLRGLERDPGLGFVGDPFQGGLQKSQFQHIKAAGRTVGAGLDALVLLEERLDLRIEVTALLSGLFERKVELAWDSGRLLCSVAATRTNVVYDLRREECHGIKELLVLLTHLLHFEDHVLIIDEPEQNLHPQYQAFLVEQIRRVTKGAGDPRTPARQLVLVTHSPFILDLRSAKDLRGVWSFAVDYSPPRNLGDMEDSELAELEPLFPRLSSAQKEFFFADNPVFVEGTNDLQVIMAIQRSREVSIAAAGSCIIQCGGSHDVTRYVRLCQKLGKTAYFLYDLDSLFFGNLRGCMEEEEEVKEFLAELGFGETLRKYIGGLERYLTELVDVVRALEIVPERLRRLHEHMSSLLRQGRNPANLQRARIAILIQQARDSQSLQVSGRACELLSVVAGRLSKIHEALRLRRVYLLRNGELEHYLPSYMGDPFEVPDDAKASAVKLEVDYLRSARSDDELRARYGGLFDMVATLPGRKAIDMSPVIKEHVSDVIHQIKKLISQGTAMDVAIVEEKLKAVIPGYAQVFLLRRLVGSDTEVFEAELIVSGVRSVGQMTVKFTGATNEGLYRFSLEPVLEEHPQRA